MFTCGVRRTFSASHFLIGGDFGDKSRPHVHDYTVDVEVGAEHLDAQGFVQDITRLTTPLEALFSEWEGEDLNGLSVFKNCSPSMEMVAKTIASHLVETHALAPNVRELIVRVYEDPTAWGQVVIMRP